MDTESTEIRPSATEPAQSPEYPRGDLQEEAPREQGEQLEEQEVSAPEPVELRIGPVATLIVGLLAGALFGYAGRPLIDQRSQETRVPAAAQATVKPIASPTAVSAAVKPTAATAADSSADAARAQALMESVIADTRHFKGDPDAPVTIVEFSDFQCPYCGRFAATTEPQLNEKYVEAGKVRFGYQHFAFLGPESQWAAEASECAADQDAFWAYHDLLFARQEGENRGAFSKENLKGFAEELGLAVEAFNECLDSGEYATLVQEESQRIRTLGVRGTPAFLVNGKALVGAQPLQVFEQAIEPELENE